MCLLLEGDIKTCIDDIGAIAEGEHIFLLRLEGHRRSNNPL